uniref:Uncharacterized protein n=1 Tax=Chromera velia CCMP2878 TaxID=1169474 RepID=A0A0K6S9B2_9ALVE|eukprot:Cvel_7648.t2-p1 / transcript=Cvel_7648.t2 / gene=Cvel_7648 / organism=Chromera_velia_CCMP2878 / gene_product=ATP-dependent zinc metalloprotease FtsH, putative / transcript_product=ATP-dependent zinc metalloprotease FtsH, putative / location=Cvel_scaffold404:73071-82329(+) / protein_length=470 / sequence_SO=supercontig / SO=protein_coding / is_pseudo=false
MPKATGLGKLWQLPCRLVEIGVTRRKAVGTGSSFQAQWRGGYRDSGPRGRGRDGRGKRGGGRDGGRSGVRTIYGGYEEGEVPPTRGFGVGGRQDIFPPSAAATGFSVGERQNVFPLSAAATGFDVGGQQDVFPPSAAATGIGVGLGGGESFTDEERVVVVDGEDVVTIKTELPIHDCHARDPGLGVFGLWTVFPPSAVVLPPSAAATGFGMGGWQDVFPPSIAATDFSVRGRQDVFPPSVAATGFGGGGRQDVFPPSAAAIGFSVGGWQDIFPLSAAATGFGVGERQAVSEGPINKKAPAFGGRFEFNGYNSKRCRQSLIRAYFVILSLCLETQSVEEVLEAMKKLRRRYEIFKLEFPEIVWLDRDCCGEGAMKAAWRILNPHIKILLDVFHWIDRLSKGLHSKSHPYTPLFVKKIQKALFVLSKEDLDKLLTAVMKAESLAAADLSCSVAKIMSSERPVFLTEVDLTNL